MRESLEQFLAEPSSPKDRRSHTLQQELETALEAQNKAEAELLKFSQQVKTLTQQCEQTKERWTMAEHELEALKVAYNECGDASPVSAMERLEKSRRLDESAAQRQLTYQIATLNDQLRASEDAFFAAELRADNAESCREDLLKRVDWQQAELERLKNELRSKEEECRCGLARHTNELNNQHELELRNQADRHADELDTMKAAHVSVATQNRLKPGLI